MKRIFTLLLAIIFTVLNLCAVSAAPRTLFGVEKDEVRPTTAWSVSVSNVSQWFTGVEGKNAMDGDVDSKWVGGSPQSGTAQYVTVDMGDTTEISGVRIYLADFSLYSSYHIKGSVYISENGSSWTNCGSYENTYDAENPNLILNLPFGKNVKTRYVRYQIDSLNDTPAAWGAAALAEIRMLKPLESSAKKAVRATTSADTTPAEGKVTLTIGSVEATVDGNAVTLDAAPYIEDGATMVPMQFLTGAVGGDYIILGDGAQVRIGNENALLTKDSFMVIHNGTAVKIKHKTVVENGIVMIPVQILKDIFGLNVSWNQKEMTIVIAK